METRTLIERAKGIIIAQQHCSPSTLPSCSAYCPSSTAMGTSDRILTGYGLARRCRSGEPARLRCCGLVALLAGLDPAIRAIRFAAGGRQRAAAACRSRWAGQQVRGQGRSSLQSWVLG